MSENTPDFIDIARRAQHLANTRGGDYGDLTHDELCAFMVEYDRALSKSEGAEGQPQYTAEQQGGEQ